MVINVTKHLGMLCFTWFEGCKQGVCMRFPFKYSRRKMHISVKKLSHKLSDILYKLDDILECEWNRRKYKIISETDKEWVFEIKAPMSKHLTQAYGQYVLNNLK